MIKMLLMLYKITSIAIILGFRRQSVTASSDTYKYYRISLNIAIWWLIFVSVILANTEIMAEAVTTYHYDNWRTGWNRFETTLTPANVDKLQLLKAVTLDEQVDAQPLLVPGVTIGAGSFSGTRHDVVYLATENDTVYAVDAETGAVLLTRRLGRPVPQSSKGSGPRTCNNNSAVVGIDSTPVIDRQTSTLYVMAYTYPTANPTWTLHALDLATLRDKTTAVVQATATLSDGNNWSFEPAYSRQRAALLEANGNVYAGFGSFCDLDADISRGWLLGWRAGSLTPLASNHLNNRLAQAPNYSFLSSIWMSGYGIAADPAGHLFFVTGNSDPSGKTWNSHYNLSESVVKISPDLTNILSYFTPWGSLGVAYLDEDDRDFGSGGVLLLPEQPGKLFLATAAGKVGQMYLLDRNRLGGHHWPNPVLGTYSIGGCWCGESYFTGWDGIGRVVSSGGNQIIIWRLRTSPSVSLVKDSASPELIASVQNPGFFTSVSSNGTNNMIVWAVGHPIDSDPAEVTLYAFDPRAAAKGGSGWLFVAPAGTWPHTTGNANIVPVVANGRVYVASYRELAIFGLAPAGGSRQAAATLAAIAPPAPPQLPGNAHEISGTIKTVAGGDISLTTRAGELVRVDATDAARRHLSVVFLVGEPVTVFGTYRTSGVLHATEVLHAKPSPKGWPADR
jgi:hypothetical protein